MTRFPFFDSMHRAHTWTAPPELLALGTLLFMVTPAPAQGWGDEDWGDETTSIEIHGMVEGAAASRLRADPAMEDDFLLGDARFRLDLTHAGDRAEFSFKGDLLSDAITEETLIDLRRVWIDLTLTHWLDLRMGRQVLTWGTGDLVFLNDLFPKDFQSFFIGRHDEFLKAPSNTVKLSAYSGLLNMDLAWTPVFEPDTYISGERLSYYDPMAATRVGADTSMAPRVPKKTFRNGELAARLFRNLGGYELAAYGYWGFYKQPTAYDAETQSPTFAPLAVGGASVRGNIWGGLFNLEGAAYVSRDDRDGDDPHVPNSEVRGLAGFEREVFPRLTLAVQYNFERLQQYETLRANASNPGISPEGARNIGTMRLTWRLMQDTLTLSLFGFVGMGDGDTHWRPSVTRNVTDAVNVTLGANIMTGSKDTFFGQLENNTNAYLRMRYSF